MFRVGQGPLPRLLAAWTQDKTSVGSHGLTSDIAGPSPAGCFRARSSAPGAGLPGSRLPTRVTVPFLVLVEPQTCCCSGNGHRQRPQGQLSFQAFLSPWLQGPQEQSRPPTCQRKRCASLLGHSRGSPRARVQFLCGTWVTMQEASCSGMQPRTGSGLDPEPRH